MNKVALSVLGGVAAGALLGVLFAPEKGSKTRRRIVEKGNDYADEAKNKIESLVGSINKTYDSIKQEGKNLMAEGKSKMDYTTKNEIKDLSGLNLK